MIVNLLQIGGFEAAILGARASWESEHDSEFEPCEFYLGPKDTALLQRLILAGDSHSKGVRQIVVWLKIKAPMYWWRHFDTYRYDVVVPPDDEEPFDWNACSESTMHTLMRKVKALRLDGDGVVAEFCAEHFINTPEDMVGRFLVYAQTKGTTVEQLAATLPPGFLQTRYGRLSYQALRRIYTDRRNHKLNEWRVFCDFIETLPHAKQLITVGDTGTYDLAVDEEWYRIVVTSTYGLLGATGQVVDGDSFYISAVNDSTLSPEDQVNVVTGYSPELPDRLGFVPQTVVWVTTEK